MICPRCNADLNQRDRTGLRCNRCRRQFALDPKTNSLALHDMRLRRLAGILTDKGQLVYTADQLRYAASRRHLGYAAVRPSLPYFATARGVGRARTSRGEVCSRLVVATVAGLMTAGTAVSGEIVIAFFGAPITLIFLVRSVTAIRANRTGRAPPSPDAAAATAAPKLVAPTLSPPMSATEFRAHVIERWRNVYGSLPPGLVDDARPVAAYEGEPTTPRLALLCTERSVRLCLLANHAPEKYQVALASTIAVLPEGVPVAVLHDASPAGYTLLAQARATVGDRPVLDLGIRPSSVLRGSSAVRLRDAPPSEQVAEELRSYGTLADDELDWLRQGWWSPVAALRPTVLLAAVAAAADRAAAAGDPDKLGARRVGFTTWPAY